MTHKEAIHRSDWKEWQEAMETEIKQLEDLGTYVRERLPKDRTAIDCKWVYRIKRDDKGNITRYKARLVTKGFSQIPGIDFTDTFAPVMRLDSLRLLLALATKLDLVIHVVDVVGAYLNGKLEEEIYMKQPPGFEDSTDNVCKLV